eukprot:scaffold424945_cov36-Prasinocladus_malaysianus.AAC.1
MHSQEGSFCPETNQIEPCAAGSFCPMVPAPCPVYLYPSSHSHTTALTGLPHSLSPLSVIGRLSGTQAVGYVLITVRVVAIAAETTDGRT